MIKPLSISPYEWIHACMNYSTDIEDRDIWLSSDPHYPDNLFTYSTAAGAMPDGIRHPYTTYFNSTPEVSRNAFTWFTYDPTNSKSIDF